MSANPLLGRALAAAIRRAGAPGHLRFTERQLYYELCRVLQPLHRAPRRPLFTLPAPIRYERYRAALRRHGDIPGLLIEPTAPPPRTPQAPDLFDYGFPRALICQDRAIAAMLLANELHMESACPVFCCADLPLDPPIRAALDRVGDATVYVLHDASAAGIAALARVRDWAGKLRVGALGLRPAHAAALHLTTTRTATATDTDTATATATGTGTGTGTDPAIGNLEPWERRWLRSGRCAEVAAVNPARLLRTVHRLVRGRARVRPPVPRLRQIQAAGFMSWPPGAARS